MIRHSDAQTTPAVAAHPRHPRGRQTEVLLTSVFGPYAQDDDYGSRRLNPMELYHNQVTRVQGPFSLRMFHRSWGLMLIQSNITAPCMLLDFPTRERFIEEITRHRYDVVGISSIRSNMLKVREMCRLVRLHLPGATIVVGGHIANTEDLLQRIDADLVVRGEGVRWFRRFLGEDADRPIAHPMIVSGIGTRVMGMALKEKPGAVAATVIPSVGCPIGCDFCSTSAMFGGKGHFVDFYKTGDELFAIMNQLEQQMRVQSFFLMDENFLLHRQRALRLLQLIEQHNKSWSLFVFSSANALRNYTIEQLVRLGISWVWMGIEGKESKYDKLTGCDTVALIRTLQTHGIRVLGSTIIGLDEHTPQNIDQAIDHAVAHDTDFHQFMLFTPTPGTPLYRQWAARGLMKTEDEVHPADIHGQLFFSHRHPHIHHGQEAEFIERAFQRDFERNGPSLARIMKTTLTGWQRYKTHPDPRVRRRFAQEVRGMTLAASAAVGAAARYYPRGSASQKRMAEILGQLHREFGWRARLAGAFAGRYLLRKIRAEERRQAAGWTYEPPTFYETNRHRADRPGATLCRQVGCRAPASRSAPPDEATQPALIPQT